MLPITRRNLKKTLNRKNNYRFYRLSIYVEEGRKGDPFPSCSCDFLLLLFRPGDYGRAVPHAIPSLCPANPSSPNITTSILCFTPVSPFSLPPLSSPVPSAAHPRQNIISSRPKRRKEKQEGGGKRKGLHGISSNSSSMSSYETWEDTSGTGTGARTGKGHRNPTTHASPKKERHFQQTD